MYLVVNEWLLEYSVPGTDKTRVSQVSQFFQKFYSSPSMIVIGRTTPFTSKFYRFFKQHESDPVFKQNYIKLLNLLFKDTLRTRILEESEIERLPDELLTGIHDDDRYLLELANTVKESVIITTDSRLIKALAEKKIARSIHLLEYIK